ncbi:replication protein A 70 kDa DNA-binding subunit B [Capsicum annuum]
MKNEQQVSIVLYSDDIPKYKNLFLLFHTYLVSCAKVRDARGYLIRAGRYEWVADKYTIVEPITDNDGLEAPLAALEKLSPLPFSAIEQQHPGSEFDLLAVVVNCSALQYTVDQSKHFREAIVMDQSKKPFLFTIWDDLADNEGTTLLDHLHEHPAILAKRIGITEFRGVLRLATRYQTTILPNPQYVQGEADRTNVVVLYFRSSSSSTSSLNLAPIEDQVQSISTIPQSLSMTKPGKVVGPGFAYDFGNKEKHDSRPQSRNVVDPPPQIMPSAYC